MNSLYSTYIIRYNTSVQVYKTTLLITGINYIQGVSVKSSHQEKHNQYFVIEAKWLCNMSYEQKFCGLSEYVRL